MQSALDYRFGWRWLLPSCSGQQAVYFGLSHEEQKWWTQNLAKLSLKATPSPTEGCLIALDHCDISSVVGSLNGMYLSWICAWGTGSTANRLRKSLGEFGSFREYALIPAGNPRIIVPLSSSKHVIAGLCLHRPGRWVAQFGLLVARSLAKFGYFGLVRRQVLLVATRSPDIPIGAVRARLKVDSLAEQTDYALYLGTPDDNRKTVVLPLGAAQPEVILKVAGSSKARAGIQNEAQALQVLAVTPLAHQVPKLIGIHATDYSLTLLQEYRSRLFANKYRFDAGVVDFLVELSRLERMEIRLVEMLLLLPQHVGIDLPSRVEIAATRLKEKLTGLSKNGARGWVHRCHGDFAPWNCIWTDKGLFVFDWEESKANELALGDAFYFVLSPFVHVEKKPDAEFVMKEALQFSEKLTIRAGFDELDVRMYLAIWLLQRLTYTPFYGELMIRLERNWQ